MTNPKDPAEATNPTSGSRELIRDEWHLWLRGTHKAARAGEYLPVRNPATGEILCHVARADANDVDDAVAAAANAATHWAALPTQERGRIIFEIARRLRQSTEELGTIECLNSGKPLREARQDVEKCAAAFEFYGGLCDKLFGSTIPVSPGFLNYTVREPVGVTAHIAPWNYPLRLAVRSVAPALACGNTVVLKPAEQTPLTVLRLGEILADAGVPDGVYNVVPGLGHEAGAALAGHPRIHHVSFTGSVAAGIDVMQRAAQNVVPVTLELGGKSPNIVFADADLERALDGAIKAIFVNAGQVCCAGSRLLLEETIYDEFIERLIQRSAQLQLGPGIEDPDMGPLISESQQQRVLEYIEIGRSEGGQLLAGGGVPSAPACRAGYFVEPTILAGVTNAARVSREEIFGPVLTVYPFKDETEAVELANDNPFGLVAGVWTTSLRRAHEVAARIKAGQVYVNDFFSASVACPFGGYKRSGFGRERGIEAMQHYTQVKSVCVRLGD